MHVRNLAVGGRLTALTLVYGQRAVRMDYNRALFGMRLAACRALSQVLIHHLSSATCMRAALRPTRRSRSSQQAVAGPGTKACAQLYVGGGAFCAGWVKPCRSAWQERHTISQGSLPP